MADVYGGTTLAISKATVSIKIKLKVRTKPKSLLASMIHRYAIVNKKQNDFKIIHIFSCRVFYIMQVLSAATLPMRQSFNRIKTFENKFLL